MELDELRQLWQTAPVSDDDYHNRLGQLLSTMRAAQQAGNGRLDAALAALRTAEQYATTPARWGHFANVVEQCAALWTDRDSIHELTEMLNFKPPHKGHRRDHD